jgi:TRAP transporter TAXI family solute receptor
MGLPPTLPLPGGHRIGRRRAAQAVIVAVVALGLSLRWLLPVGGAADLHGPLVVATGVSTGVYDTYGRLLAPVLQKDLPSMKVKLLPSQGSVQNIDYVVDGRADFTFAQADAVADYHGSGRPQLRAVARLYDDYMQLIVPANSTVRSARDLRGLRVGVGQPGSGVNLIAQRLLRAAGLDPAKDLTTEPYGIDTAPAMLEQGKLDAFFWSGGLPTVAVTTLTEHFPVKLVQLGDLIGPLHELGAAAKYYRAAAMPADAYPRMHEGAVPTIAVANLLITTVHENADVVQRVTQAVIDSRDRIGAVVHSAQQVDLRTAIYTDPLPLHEGARRYYQSVKP